jgi:hypothetical protein
MILIKLEFSGIFSKIIQISNFRGNPSIGSRIVRGDRQTDMTELIFANLSSAYAPKKYFAAFYHTGGKGL